MSNRFRRFLNRLRRSFSQIPHAANRQNTARRHKRLAPAEILETRRLLTADFQVLKDINAVQPVLNPTDIQQVGSITYIAASTPVTGNELWKTDGTATGTILVRA